MYHMWCFCSSGKEANLGLSAVSEAPTPSLKVVGARTSTDKNELVPCTCGIFLTGQFVKGSHQQPSEGPALLHEHDHTYPCSPIGRRQCANKCLEVVGFVILSLAYLTAVHSVSFNIKMLIYVRLGKSPIIHKGPSL